MISKILSKWIQGWLQEADPEKVRSWVYLTQVALGAVIILGLLWLRDREATSGFRVREADLKKKKKSDFHRNSPAPLEDALAEARYQAKPEALRLAGISIQGAPHEILGIPANADESQIRSSYRELMKRYHPDRVGRPGSREWNDAQKIAEAINDAKEKMLSVIRKN